MKFATLSAVVFGAAVCFAGELERYAAQQCNTGPIQCCNQLKNYNELNIKERNQVTNIVGGVVDKLLHGQFGIDCTPVGVLGGAGNNCNAQPVCCEKVQTNALVAISCVPININL
ncbi:unnamed protein product [Cunninghamella echinulata]